MIAKGTFQVKITPEPPYDVDGGVSLGRAAIEKVFSGPLEATAKATMIGARTKVESSAGYVAIERVTGTLDGKRGTFVLQHSGTMNRGVPSLTVTVVPDSGTGELEGIQGRMAIDIVDGQHFYSLEYEISGR
jgi:hypothetical protein